MEFEPNQEEIEQMIPEEAVEEEITAEVIAEEQAAEEQAVEENTSENQTEDQVEAERMKKFRALKRAKTATFIVGVVGVYLLYLTLTTFKGKWTGSMAEMPRFTLAMCAGFLVAGIVLVVLALRLNKKARGLERSLWEDMHPGEDFDEFMKSRNQRSLTNPRESAGAQPMNSNKMSDRLAQLKRLNEMADEEEEEDVEAEGEEVEE